jgi:hypothetical protein
MDIKNNFILFKTGGWAGERNVYVFCTMQRLRMEKQILSSIINTLHARKIRAKTEYNKYYNLEGWLSLKLDDLL